MPYDEFFEQAAIKIAKTAFDFDASAQRAIQELAEEWDVRLTEEEISKLAIKAVLSYNEDRPPDDDNTAGVRHCERCGEAARVEEIPLHGYSLYLCRKCAAAAFRCGEAV